MGVGLLAALWFWTALRDQRRLGAAERSEHMANRTAKLHAKLARERAEEAGKLRTLTEKVSKTRSRLLTAGFLSGGALGLGLALMLTQFLTLGVLAVGFAGGSVVGYLMRGWLHRLTAPGSGAAMSVGTASAAPAELPAPRSKGLTLRSVKARAA